MGGRPGGRVYTPFPTQVIGVPLRHAIEFGRAAAARPFVGLRSHKGVARPKKRACAAHTPFSLGVGVGVQEKEVLRVSSPCLNMTTPVGAGGNWLDNSPVV